MLQSSLQRIFPDCDDLSKISSAGFQAHLTLGQFPSSQIIDIKAKYQQQWKPIRFLVNSVSIISRTETTPFSVKHIISFGIAESIKSTLVKANKEETVVENVVKWIKNRNHKEHLPKTKEKLERTIEPICCVRVDADTLAFHEVFEQLGLMKSTNKTPAKLIFNFSSLNQSGEEITKKLLETKLTTQKFKGLSSFEMDEVLKALNGLVKFLRGPSAPSTLKSFSNAIKQFAHWKREIAPTSIIEKLISMNLISVTLNQETNESNVKYNI